MVDMHSHVLPGIDDGAKTPEDSVIDKKDDGAGDKKNHCHTAHHDRFLS
jgi:protein-tyrosine phosphatase